MKLKVLLYGVAAALFATICSGQARPAADIIVTNANIYTVDKQHPKAEAMAVVGEQAKKTPKGEWMLGGDWDETKWPAPALPSKDLVDPVTPNTPIFINRYDGHMALANSLAMKLAGVTAKTPDVPGGVILRDSHGNPTGIFKDAAQNLFEKAIPTMSHERRLQAARRALE